MQNKISEGFRAISLLVLLAGASACDTPLETGYAPHKLDASDADRRAYYAPAFSPDTHGQKTGSGVDFGAMP
jgi:hypothetical protein